MTDKIVDKIKSICQNYKILPDRSKGQNFLINKKIIEKIITAANIKPSDTILEIGPGLGILTEDLLKETKKLISVELDKEIFNFLKANFSSYKNLELINADILKLPTISYLPFTPYKIVANLPYNITSFFLRKFLTIENKPAEMTLLIQKEVAERICATAGKMSLLSVSIQLYGEPKIIDFVDKKNFWPQPKIDSAILKIDSIKNKKTVDKYLGDLNEKDFWRIVKVGFSAKRKQLHNNLSSGLKISSLEMKNLLKEANFDPQLRAQNLSVDDWVALAKKLNFHLNK